MTTHYSTSGTLYIVPTLNGRKGIVGLDYSNYENLLSKDIMDEEVDLTIQKALYGSEYEQGAPTHKLRAGLYTIKIEGLSTKPQMDIAESEIASLIARGFEDGDSVNLTIEKLPYLKRREAGYDDIQMSI